MFCKENRVYVTCQTDDDLDYVLGYAGEDNLVIGTDYGHSDNASGDRSAAQSYATKAKSPRA